MFSQQNECIVPLFLSLLQETLEKLVCQPGIQGSQFGVLFQRFLSIPQRYIGDCQVEVCLSIGRPEPDSFVKGGRCFLITFGPNVHSTNIIMSLSVVTFQRQRFLVSLDRLIELLVLVKRSPQTVVSLNVVEFKSNSLL